MDITSLTIEEIRQGLRKKLFSAKEVTESFLKKIYQEDKEIQAFLSVFEKEALSQAQEIDNLIAKNQEIPLLAGVPMAVKDNILVKGFPCTAASLILKNYKAPYDATCIKKLKKQGVVILGKTNLDEFAMGSSTEHSAFKTTRNPRDKTRVPGGSSGGSAAAVAARECCFSLGSDTGGSIRQPAAFCGVVGFKPTYGRVSRYGLIAFASSLDQIGPLTKTVKDAEIVFEAIAGKDEMDSTTQEVNKESFSSKEIKNLRIGIPKEYFGEGIDEKVKEVIKKTIEKAEKKGAKIEEISLPHTKYALSCYYIIAPSEASANLARYDGVKYGYQEESQSLKEIYLKTRGRGFGKEVKRRIMIGTYALSSGYYDAYYLRAQKVRTKIKEDFDRAFEKVDVIFSPTSPFLPFKIGERIDDPLKMYLSDVFTVPANLAGLPAISVPCSKENLPAGLQIIGPAFGEKEVFAAAAFVEALTQE